MSKFPAHLWHREAREQALKEWAIVQAGQPPTKLALGGARRSNEKNVLPAECCQEHQPRLVEHYNI
jgi:hypothetical protein